MGKKSKKYGDVVLRPQPLSDQILLEKEVTPSVRTKKKLKNEDNTDAEYVDGTLGKAIIKQSLAQLRELDEEEFPPLGKVIERKRNEDFRVSLVRQGVKKISGKRKLADYERDVSDTEDHIDESENATPLNVENEVKSFEAWLDLDSQDLSILDHFEKKESTEATRLADLFRDKITEKQTEIQSQIDNASIRESTLKPETIQQCKEIGEVLHKYRSGPLPKMLKTFPAMSCWEELLLATDPEKWTAAAMYQVTRIFVSNLQTHLAQHFCRYVLLPRIRDDISFYKRLNYHLYQALVKVLYKSLAFFKGIILPLCLNGDCTLREAIIIGSVLSNKHIVRDHFAAAVQMIFSMKYHGAHFIFLRVFFDKKYSLPYSFIENCIKNFLRFKTEGRNLPVLWHQALLSFVQNYKNDLSKDQKEDISGLIKFQSHYKITPQIRRELQFEGVERMDLN